MSSQVYLIPTVLSEGVYAPLPAYVLDAVKKCSVFFVESERTARRFLKGLWKEMVIDDYKWYAIKEPNASIKNSFSQHIKAGAVIAILSEAGCPGIADPGQELVAIAQEMKAVVHPLVGPNSILLALMASGMNGQHFEFHGYLPIQGPERTKAIQKLENDSRNKNCTQIFIETPYRNEQMMQGLISQCHPATKICIAADLTGPTEMVITKTVQEWKKEMPAIHKRPAIFLLYCGA